MKAILALPFILVGVILLIETLRGAADALPAGVVLFIVLFVIWLVMPRKYMVLDDSIRIVLGGPFAFGIPYTAIKAVREGDGTFLGISMVTSLSGKRLVCISRHKGMSVAITPTDRGAFLLHALEGIEAYRKTASRTEKI